MTVAMPFLLLWLAATAFCGVFREKRQMAAHARRWTTPIPIYFDPNFSVVEVNKIRAAIHHIEANTCITFKEQKTMKHAVPIWRNGSCSAKALGMMLPSKYYHHLSISLNPDPPSNCLETIGVVEHELFHLLGMIHTIERSDAVDYVTVNVNNLQGEQLWQFRPGTEMRNFTPYDYSSIMHYGSHLSRNSSSVNPLSPTLVAKHDMYQYTMGNQKEATYYDLHELNMNYKCYDRCPNMTAADCSGRGMPNPSNCSKCICPSGFTGDKCDRRPVDCGGFLHATERQQGQGLWIGNTMKKKSFEFSYCVYWIMTHREDRFIEMVIDGITEAGSYNHSIQETASCRIYGIEVKQNLDPRIGGQVFCGDPALEKRFVSQSNILPVILFSREGYQAYSITYKSVKAPKIDPAPM